MKLFKKMSSGRKSSTSDGLGTKMNPRYVHWTNY